MEKIYGWYDSPHQARDKPTYNPSFYAPCPHCRKPLTDDDARTHSILYFDAPQSFFYRTHRTCDEAATDEQRHAIDAKIFDMIAADKVVGNIGGQPFLKKE